MKKKKYRRHVSGNTIRYDPSKHEYVKRKQKPIPFCVDCGKRTCCEAYSSRPRNKNKSLGKQKFSHNRQLNKYQANNLKKHYYNYNCTT